jgi:hypothetical protein
VVELVDGPSSGTRVVRTPGPQLKEGTAVKEKESK